MTPSDSVGRRDLLRVAGVAGAAVVAGCTNGESGDSSPTNATAPSGSTSDAIPQEWPMTGDPVEEVEPLEEALLDYMREREISAGALAVSNYGDVIYERGFGWADGDRTTPVDPDALFRIGSVSKPITDAAVRRLVDDGRLELDDRVYPFLEIDPPSDGLGDERFREIEVGHLLAHQGGWDRRESIDPTFEPFTVAESLGLSRPPTADDVVRYVLGQPLQFDPGERSAYSNVGYSVLAKVVEGASGRTYQDFLREAVLDPVDATEIRRGRTAPDDRPPREVAYDDSERCPNAAALEADDRVSCADGGIVLEALEGACGHVATAGSLLSFMDAYWLDGQTRSSRDGEWVYFGSLPGAFAMATQRADGIDVVALFNRRTGDAEGIHPILSEAANRVDDWPY
ncbi:serine hydrolase domain-containing protein [Natrononativus amylolyticus]|uniref:serine hydrolase domain-containing protein n=1 Tax=Natrononativus amylolyticus TaxID=2963434 RepID=UPI0020CEE638|nr:serine hydrolase domain-containing protein [Natrononativus amylolyticus]